MATTRGQRIGIWVITGALLLGTLGGFLVMVLAPRNEATDQARMQEEYQKIIKEQEEQAKARAASSQPLEGYETTKFDKAAVTELRVETLVQGEGETLTEDDTIQANYFGWLSDGTIFDSTRRDNKTEPIEFSLAGVINGWRQGLSGVKVGSVVRLTIPAALAYGESGSSPLIGPNESLQFIVEIKDKK